MIEERSDTAVVREALRELLPDRELESTAVIKRGHIHDTIVAHCRAAGGGDERYVVQRINSEVFHDPDALAANLARVTDHLRGALRARGAADLDPVSYTHLTLPTNSRV